MSLQIYLRIVHNGCDHKVDADDQHNDRDDNGALENKGLNLVE